MCRLERRRQWALFFVKSRYNYSSCTLWWTPFHLLCGQERWGHAAVEQSMGTTSAYLRSLRGIIPLIVSPGNAPAWLLIVSRKHNLKIKQEKWKDSRKINTFLIHFFFQSKLRITFNSVSSVKVYSHSESLLPPKWSCLVLFMWLRKEAGPVWLEDTSYFSGVVDSLGDRAVNWLN